MLRALGFRFLDSLGEEIIYAKDLNKIASIDKSKVLDELKECRFKIACDVNNPLYGPNGAAHIYAKQKGANEAMIERLDENLKVFASFVDDDLARVQGSGAAGGLGFGFLAFLNATLKSGIKIILEEIQFKKKIAGADFVITGEGRVDKQSFMGKVLDGVGRTCKEQDIPCIILCGSCQDIASDAYDKGITCVFSTLDAPMHLDEAMEKKKTLYLIEKKSEQIFRLIKQCRK
jgi:glycerate kinase